MSNLERLVYMANQIARNFEALGHEVAFKATPDHIASFWDPRMKAQIFAYLESGGSDLSKAGRAAIELLRETEIPPRRRPPPSSTRSVKWATTMPGSTGSAGIRLTS